jgi:putative ABC transport system ATP-binding protein
MTDWIGAPPEEDPAAAAAADGRERRPAETPVAPLVRVEDVSKTYRDGGSETPVLRAAGLEIARGETTSLVGVSGSGKSTLISVIAGLLLPDSGRVVIDGQDTTGLDDAARARIRAERIGVVLQSGNLIPFLTAKENVELAIGLAGGDEAGSRAEALLEEVGLADRVHHLPRRLSGGEAQRVSLAVALANEPDLLLADEATGELDSSTAEHVMEVIFDAWRERGLSVLLVTHRRELAASAQRRLQLVEGQVVPA